MEYEILQIVKSDSETRVQIEIENIDGEIMFLDTNNQRHQSVDQAQSGWSFQNPQTQALYEELVETIKDIDLEELTENIQPGGYHAIRGYDNVWIENQDIPEHIFVKSFRTINNKLVPLDYYIKSEEKIENGCVGRYEKLPMKEGIKYLCEPFEGELDYIGYATTPQELTELVDYWGVESGEGSDWSIDEFTGEGYYVMVYCTGQNKGGAYMFDEALSFFWDEDPGEVMMNHLLEKELRFLDRWNGYELREFIMDLLDAHKDKTFEQELDSELELCANISFDDFDGDIEKALSKVKAVDLWDDIKELISFNHIDTQRCDL